MGCMWIRIGYGLISTIHRNESLDSIHPTEPQTSNKILKRLPLVMKKKDIIILQTFKRRAPKPLTSLDLSMREPKIPPLIP